MLEDSFIIKMFFDRNEEAITHTSKKYNNYIFKISYNILGKHEEAEECVNDTYMALWNKIPPNKPNSFIAFIGKLIRNISLDKYQYLKAKKRNNSFDLSLSELNECIPSNNTIDNYLKSIELGKIISKFLNTCKKTDKLIFIRRYWYSDSINNISIKFNFSNSKVKSILYRTRKKLKLYLESEVYSDEL